MTLREYIDSLPEKSQQWLKDNCKFIDFESKDGYRHYEPQADIIETRLADQSYNRKISESEIVVNMLLLRDDKGEYVYGNSNTMSTDERNETVYRIVYDRHGSEMLNYRETYYLPLGYVRLAAKEKIKRYQEDQDESNKNKLRLVDLLLFTDDFSNIDWNTLYMDSYYEMNEALLAIFPKEIAKKYLLERPDALAVDNIPMNCDVFDELFFGEDGWTEDQKKVILRKFTDTTNSVANFMERIVAVDKKYLRYIYQIICRTRDSNGPKSFSNQLYCLQKPVDELANCKKKLKYRYSDEYRKLFWIVRCCYLGYTNRTAVSKMKDAGSILKLYGYNFDEIFNMLYPEYAPQQAVAVEA